MRPHLLTIVTALLLCLTNETLAQKGGDLAAASAPTSERPWVPPDSRLGVRTAPILLLTRPDVQADLGLSTEATASLDQAVAELFESAAKLRGRSDAGVLEARRAIDEAQQTWIDSNLTDEQRKRLIQIDLQWEGPSAVITRPWVANMIELTAQQRSELAAAVAKSRDEAQLPSGSAKRLSVDVMETLSPEQEARWQSLLGHAFVVQVGTNTNASDPAVQRASVKQ